MMPDSTSKMIQDIETERERSSNLTRKDLEKAYIDLEKDKFASDKRIRFTAGLAECTKLYQ